MLNCLLWGTGHCFTQNVTMLNHMEIIGLFSIVAVTSNLNCFSNYAGYEFVKKEEINCEDYEIVIIMAEDKRTIIDIREEVLDKGFKYNQIIPFNVMGKPGFDINKYLKLLDDIPTIFAPNCWGGATYNYLGLEFHSPFINMFEKHDEYIQFLKSPKYYMEKELQPHKMVWDNQLDREYPILKCGDLSLYCNHYHSFEEAIQCWNRRRDRINWDNLFVMDFEVNPDLTDEFEKLPYKKKICFVPFDTSNSSCIKIDYKRHDSLKNKEFWQIVNGMAYGKYLYYDIFDLLVNNTVSVLSTWK